MPLRAQLADLPFAGVGEELGEQLEVVDAVAQQAVVPVENFAFPQRAAEDGELLRLQVGGDAFEAATISPSRDPPVMPLGKNRSPSWEPSGIGPAVRRA